MLKIINPATETLIRELEEDTACHRGAKIPARAQRRSPTGPACRSRSGSMRCADFAI